MTKRKYVVSHDDFEKCVGEGAISIDIFGKPFGDEIRKLSVGAFAVALQGYENKPASKLFLTMWKCRGEHVNCLVARAELAGFQSKLNSVKSN